MTGSYFIERAMSPFASLLLESIDSAVLAFCQAHMARSCTTQLRAAFKAALRTVSRDSKSCLSRRASGLSGCNESAQEMPDRASCRLFFRDRRALARAQAASTSDFRRRMLCYSAAALPSVGQLSEPAARPGPARADSSRSTSPRLARRSISSALRARHDSESSTRVPIR